MISIYFLLVHGRLSKSNPPVLPRIILQLSLLAALGCSVLAGSIPEEFFITGNFAIGSNQTVVVSGAGLPNSMSDIVFTGVNHAYNEKTKVHTVTADAGTASMYLLAVTFTNIVAEPENNRFTADATIAVPFDFSTTSMHVGIPPGKAWTTIFGSFTLKKFSIPGVPLKLGNIIVTIDDVHHRFGGQGTVGWSGFLTPPPGSYCESVSSIAAPFTQARQLGGGLFFQDGVVQDVTLLGDNLRLQIGATTAYVDFLSLGVQNPTTFLKNGEIDGEMKINGGCPYIFKNFIPIYPATLDVKGVFDGSGAFTVKGSGSIFSITAGTISLGYTPKYNVDLGATLSVLGIVNGDASVGFDAAGLSGSIGGSIEIPSYVPLVGGTVYEKGNASFSDVGFAGSFKTKIVPAIPEICTKEIIINYPCIPYFCGPWYDIFQNVCYTCPSPTVIPAVCIPAVPAVYAEVTYKFQGTDVEFNVKSSVGQSAAFGPSAPMIPLNTIITGTNELGFIEMFANFSPLESYSSTSAQRTGRITPSGLPAPVLFNIPTNSESVILLVSYATNITNMVDVQVTPPGGVAFSSLDGLLPIGLPNRAGYARATPGATTIYLHKPVAGSYQVFVPGGAALGNYSITSNLQNHKPTLELLSIEETATNGVLKVKWSCEDADNNARVRFYLTEHRENHKGLLLASAFEDETNRVTYLDTREAKVHPGHYYIMASASDGVNATAYAYSDTKIHVDRPSAPSPVTHIEYKEGDTVVAVQWDAPAGPEPTRYQVLYTTNHSASIRHFEGRVAVASPKRKVEISNLENGRPIIITVVAEVDEAGYSEAVDFVRATPSPGIGANPPLIVSEPHNSAVVGMNYLYFPLIYDGDVEYTDRDPAAAAVITDPTPSAAPDYIWDFLAAPAGMTIDPSGLIQWKPSTNQIGKHTVIARATENRPVTVSGGQQAAEPVSIEQRFDIRVHPSTDLQGLNPHPHLFLTHPPLTARQGATYTYTPQILSPAGWTLKVLEGPQGMTINTNRAVVWNVPANAKGSFVRLESKTPAGEKTEQSFFLGIKSSANILAQPARLTSTQRIPSGVVVHWISEGRMHQLQRAAGPSSPWVNVGRPAVGTGSQFILDPAPLPGMAFYRLITVD